MGLVNKDQNLARISEVQQICVQIQGLLVLPEQLWAAKCRTGLYAMMSHLVALACVSPQTPTQKSLSK